MYNEIEKRNEAVQLLKNFVKLSSVLLPYYAELRRKESLSAYELNEKERLENIYQNYNANTAASIVLINSNILEIIKDTFSSITENPKSRKSSILLREFNTEWVKLRNDWDQQTLN